MAYLALHPEAAQNLHKLPQDGLIIEEQSEAYLLTDGTKAFRFISFSEAHPSYS